ncbi:molybdate ABC transporter substrate-binding protein [Thalassolituus sp. C2-1]|uniref:molybdate ABC transporter substrate-binding protein n=1 Tax=Venatorbacter sp. C2-1 TaxID=2597518 RepID=UPI001FB9C022|nr:molybdate ABC transporter substrate-binding protein [Thalassolituus sp. C2-1]
MFRLHRYGKAPLAFIGMLLSSLLLSCLLLSCLLVPSQAIAAEVMVAVASNFTAPMKDIAERFQQHSGHQLVMAFGSSGKFTAQIHNGAPFEVFLSADQAKPEALIRAGLASADSRFTYALGRLALWTTSPDVDVRAQLHSGQFRKLALANPRLAPYGTAAQQTLAALALTDSVAARQVMGENIAQTWQFVASGNAQLGFVALSQVMSGGDIHHGSVWIVPDTLYQPIRQDAVLLKKGELKKGEPNPAARAFLAFLQSAEVTELIRGYGYHRE